MGYKSNLNDNSSQKNGSEMFYLNLSESEIFISFSSMLNFFEAAAFGLSQVTV